MVWMLEGAEEEDDRDEDELDGRKEAADEEWVVVRVVEVDVDMTRGEREREREREERAVRVARQRARGTKREVESAATGTSGSTNRRSMRDNAAQHPHQQQPITQSRTQLTRRRNRHTNHSTATTHQQRHKAEQQHTIQH